MSFAKIRVPALALDGRVGHPRPGAHEAAATRAAVPAPRASPATRSGEVLIVRRDPRIAFRVVENQMNYAYLGERLKQSAADNFPVFLADLCARADAAYITPSTRSLLKMAEAGECEFPSSQALLEYATHRLLWSWYSRDRDAQASRPEWDQRSRISTPQNPRMTTAMTRSSPWATSCQQQALRPHDAFMQHGRSVLLISELFC